MHSVPSLNLSKLTGLSGKKDGHSHHPAQSNQETKRINNERSFLLDFFEKFHEAHSHLTEIATFTREEFFKEFYMIEALAVGLPNNFLSAADQDY